MTIPRSFFDITLPGNGRAVGTFWTFDRCERDAADHTERNGGVLEIWYRTPDGDALFATAEDGALDETPVGSSWRKAHSAEERQHPESGYPDGRKGQ